jgi:ABC-type lipoprotein release transport system permease subunit
VGTPWPMPSASAVDGASVDIDGLPVGVFLELGLIFVVGFTLLIVATWFSARRARKERDQS